MKIFDVVSTFFLHLFHILIKQFLLHISRSAYTSRLCNSIVHYVEVFVKYHFEERSVYSHIGNLSYTLSIIQCS